MSHLTQYSLTTLSLLQYPEAVPLKSTETEVVAEVLLGIFSRVGFPKVVLSDNGPQFVSHVMKAVARLMSLSWVHSTPFHPQANGLCEKWNGTLKRMLRRMTTERPTDWDWYVEPLLFAYREAPKASTRFSPFELLYGRTVRGPMCILQRCGLKKVSVKTFLLCTNMCLTSGRRGPNLNQSKYHKYIVIVIITT